jgi:hypothetical protein
MGRAASGLAFCPLPPQPAMRPAGRFVACGSVRASGGASPA